MKTTIIGQAVSVLLFAALLIGRGSNSAPGLGVRSTGWSQWTRDKPTVPGMDRAAVCIGLYANRPALVVRSDGQVGSFNVSWDRTRKAVHHEGAFRSSGGRNVAVHCYRSDGKTGLVAIGDETFELGNGSLFLVASSGTKSVVKQLRRDLSKLRSDLEGFQANAMTALRSRRFSSSHPLSSPDQFRVERFLYSPGSKPRSSADRFDTT
jgi:hypothetical protein